MAAIRHLGQGCFETLGQPSWTLAAKGTALQHHHAAAGAKGRRAGLLEGLGRLAGVVAIEAAEVDGCPAGIHLRLHQRFDSTVAGSFVVAPEQVNGHGRGLDPQGAEHRVEPSLGQGRMVGDQHHCAGLDGSSKFDGAAVV